MSPDPGGVATADPSNPQSWNRYAYVNGDPVNSRDRHGLFVLAAEAGDDDYCSENPMWCVLVGGPGYGVNSGNNLDGGGGGGDSTADGLAVLRSAFLAPAVSGAETLLQNADCASLFDTSSMDSTFGTTNPAIILQNAYADGQVNLYPFGDNVNPGVMAQTTETNGRIQIAANRGFVTGILANGSSLTSVPEFQGLSLSQIDEVILIHELLHFTGTAGSDNEGQSITLGNGDGYSQGKRRHHAGGR